MLVNRAMFTKKMFEYIGLTGTLFGFFIAFFPLDSHISVSIKILSFIGFFAINAAWAFVAVLPKRKMEVAVSNKVKVDIKYGDLFEACDRVVVPFNEYFDMDDNDELQARKSLHGKFIQEAFDGDVERFRSTVKEKLAGVEPKTDGLTSLVPAYPIGTTVQIQQRGKIFYLLAFTNFQKSNIEDLSIKDYQTALTALMEYLHSHSKGEKVHIPLLGGGLAGVRLSKQELLEGILSSIKFHDHLTISGGIEIILHESLKDEIDLNKVQYLYSYGKL